MNLSNMKKIIISITLITVIISSFFIYNGFYLKNEFKVIVKNLYDDDISVCVFIMEDDEFLGIKNIFETKCSSLKYDDTCVFHVKFHDYHHINMVEIEAMSVYTKYAETTYQFPKNQYYDLMVIIIPAIDNNTHINNEKTPYKIHDYGNKDYADIIFSNFQINNELKQIFIDIND